MKFLTPGEKIKETRKYLKMKQQDLQDKDLSRGLISMIEIGQRTLNKDIATKITIKFRQRAKELGIKLELDEQYLLRSPNEDAELYCLRKLEGVTSHDIIQDILEITSKFNLLNIRAMAYSKLGDYYFNNADYEEAFITYNTSISIYKDINQNESVSYLYRQIGLCKAITLQYTDALSYFKISEQHALLYKDIKTRKLSLYSLAKCYKKLNKIDLALEHIDIFLSICDKDEDFTYYIYTNILKANCYEIYKEFDTVIDMYNSLINEFSDNKNHFLGYIYNNLGIAYLNKCNFDESAKYFEMAEKISNAVDKSILSQTLIEKSNLFVKQGFYNDAINSIQLGLIHAENHKNFEDLLKGNYMLADIYEQLNDNSNLKKVYLTIATLLNNLNNINDLISIYNKLSIIYLDENNILKAREYLLMSVDSCGNSLKSSL